MNNYEASKKYHGLIVGLYADFSPDKLMSFLKSSDHYPIQEALEACEIRGLTPERIFILARMGSTRQALHLITRELADIHRAVDFCKDYDDVDLWNDLIEYSIDKPYFVNVLLHNIGTHVDPTILIQRIECGQSIPGRHLSIFIFKLVWYKRYQPQINQLSWNVKSPTVKVPNFRVKLTNSYFTNKVCELSE